MIHTIAIAAALLAQDVPEAPDQNVQMEETFAFFEPLLGGTWIVTGVEEGGAVDISSWEAVVEGRILQSTHSINHGVYGGRTLYFWDYENERLAYHYATTANFYTTGYLTRIDENTMESYEIVHGPIDIESLRGRFEITDEGYEVRVMFEQDGEWRAGDPSYYIRADEGVTVRFDGGE